MRRTMTVSVEQIAQMSGRMRSPIHELLAAYVRAESVWSHHDPVTLTAIETDAPGGSELPLLKIRAPDVQTAITVLGRRVELPAEIIELQSVDLRSAYLGDANFRRAILGRSILAEADLSHSDLSDSWLRRVNFRDAILTGVRLRRAVLRNAVLCGAALSALTCLVPIFAMLNVMRPPSGPRISIGRRLVWNSNHPDRPRPLLSRRKKTDVSSSFVVSD
jgi:hypothetical protein